MTKFLPSPRLFWLLIPVAIVVVVGLWFSSTASTITLFDRPATESLAIEQVRLEPGRIDLVVRNDGAETLTIAQVTINDTAWISLILPKPIIERFDRATIQLDDYEWLEGQAYRLVIYTSKANQFVVDIPYATTTPKPTQANVLTLLINGLLTGFLPVYLGIFWWPVIRQTSVVSIQRLSFWVALIAAVLLWRGVSLLMAAPHLVAQVANAFQGGSIIASGGAITVLGLASWRHQQTQADDQNALIMLYRLAVVIGLIGLGEGIVVGYAANSNLVNMPLWLTGSGWVLGLMLLNISRGMALAVSVNQSKVVLAGWVLAGFLAGFPALLGVLLGGFTSAVVLFALLLGGAAGATLWLTFELLWLVVSKSKANLPWRAMQIGTATGLILCWIVNLLT